MALKMGVMQKWRAGDPATIRDMAQGIDFYFASYADPELMFQWVLRYQPEN